MKHLGVSIYFEEQGIDTDKLYAEMILTFPGLLAQQESENISRNTRWSIQKRMARGEYFGTHAPLGYRFRDGRLTVETRSGNGAQNLCPESVGLQVPVACRNLQMQECPQGPFR